MAVQQRVSAGQRQQMIAEEAYFRAQRRGFDGGDTVVDWLEAEAEVDARLRETGNDRSVGGLDERLAAVTRKLEAMKKKVAGIEADVRSEWQQDIEKLTKLRDAFEKRLQEIREQGAHATQKAKDQAEKVWKEISEVIERTSSRRK
jgi:DNA anti-recombination protein RmuC